MPRKPVNPGSAAPSPQERTASRTMADVLTLPDPLRQLATWLLRQDAVRLEKVVAHLGQETEQVRALLDSLVVEGFAQVQNHDGVPQYRMSLVSRPRRHPARDLWHTLDEQRKS